VGVNWAVYRLRIAAVLFFAASPLFAGFRILTAEPRGAAPGGFVFVHLRSNGDVYFDELPTSVRFGNVPGTIVQLVNNLDLVVLAPPHNPGSVTVTVTLHGQELSTIEQFGYGIAEPVLLPIAIDSLPGANGSRWSTEIWIHNDADHAVPIDPEYCSFIGSYFPCSRPVTRIAAHSSTRLNGRGSADYPYARLFPPVQDVDSLHFSILVRDVSKDANGPATEIAAVRERELNRSGRVVLPGVANDSRYRANLRLYSAAGQIAVSLADAVTGQVLATRRIERLLPTDFDNFSLVEMHDPLAAPELRGHDRVDVIIQTNQYDRLWALLTLTDNATQQVMTFTPQ
jgi:hypothetical protein